VLFTACETMLYWVKKHLRLLEINEEFGWVVFKYHIRNYPTSWQKIYQSFTCHFVVDDNTYFFAGWVNLMACARTVWLIIVVATAFLIRCTYESKLSRVTMTLHGLFTSLNKINSHDQDLWDSSFSWQTRAHFFLNAQITYSRDWSDLFEFECWIHSTSF